MGFTFSLTQIYAIKRSFYFQCLVVVLLLCFSVCFYRQGYAQTKPVNVISQINAYRKELRVARKDSARARIYYKLAHRYTVINQDSTQYFAYLGIQLAEKFKNKQLLVALYSELGKALEAIGKAKEGLAILEKAEQISLHDLPDSSTAKIRVTQATIFTKQGENEKAIEKALLALRYYEKNPDPISLLSYIYNTLGIIYTNFGQPQKALYYLDKQREIGRKTGDQFYLYRSAVNSAAVYINIKDYKKAEDESSRALSIAQATKNNRGVSFSLDLLCQILTVSQRYAEAIELGRQSLQIRQLLNDKFLIGCSHINIAEAYKGLKQYSEALEHAKLGIDILRSTNAKTYIQPCLATIAEILENMNDYKEALSIYKEAQVIKDSLSDVEKSKEVARVQASYDFERKQNQIILLHKNIAIQQLQADKRQKQLVTLEQAKHNTDLKNQLLAKQQLLNQNQITLQSLQAKRQQNRFDALLDVLQFAEQRQLLYLTISLFLVGLLGLGGYFYRRQQSARRLLISQNEAIQQQASLLSELNTTKDKLFSLISHDLRSPLASLKLNVDQLHALPQSPLTPLRAITLQVELQLDRVLDLLTNLLEWSRAQLTGFQTIVQPLNLRQMLLDQTAQLADQLSRKDIRLINQVGQEVIVVADNHQLSTVLRNLLMNAIKFSPVGGFIRLGIRPFGDLVELQIQDGGMGISAEQLALLFISPQVREGTVGEKGTGLGLRLSQELLAQQGGSLAIESYEGRGTTIKVRLPIGQDKIINESPSNDKEALNFYK